MASESGDRGEQRQVKVSLVEEYLKREGIELLGDALDKVHEKEDDLIVQEVEAEIQKLVEALRGKDEVHDLLRLQVQNHERERFDQLDIVVSLRLQLRVPSKQLREKRDDVVLDKEIQNRRVFFLGPSQNLGQLGQIIHRLPEATPRDLPLG